MCKGCREIFSTLEMENGYCKECNKLTKEEIKNKNLKKNLDNDLDNEAQKTNKITLKNKNNGLTKTVPIGFSWTLLFFGIFVPLFRGDIKWFIITLILAIVTFGIGWLFIPFFYNKKYIIDLIEKGYEPVDKISKKVLEQQNILN